MGYDGLLDQLLEDHLPAEVRRAAIDALSLDLDSVDDPTQQQALRLLLLRAARIVQHGGKTALAQDLTDLAMRDVIWLVTPGALQASEFLDVPIRVTVQDGPPAEAAIEAQLERLNLATGPDLEMKFRFTGLNYRTDALEIALTPTTWTSARRFQTALERDPAWASKLPDGKWIMPLPFGDVLLPGIAVVHAIIVTSDRRVIAAQRSEKTSYSPLHWSVSFEEQLNEKDIRDEQGAFTAAARRGFHEEFGAEIAACNVMPLTAIMQIDLLNLGIVVLLRPSMTAEDVRDSWRSVARDGWEASEVRGLPLDDLDAGAASLGLLHPSSELRCLVLRRWLSKR